MTLSQMKKLNLGSGAFVKEGYVNLDLTPEHGADVVHDLRDFPYPFADDEFDLVEADHCLEHLPEPFAAVCEIHRITRSGGTVRIRVPHFSRGFSHPDHKAGFDVTFPYYFRKDFHAGYQGVELSLDSQKFKWFAQPYLKKTVLPRPVFYAASGAGAVISFAANLAPALCARVWCFWVGGFEEIEFRFTVVK
jgi:SAM-dependent methyltransferase